VTSQLKQDVDYLNSLCENEFDSLYELMKNGKMSDRWADAFFAWRDGEGPYE